MVKIAKAIFVILVGGILVLGSGLIGPEAAKACCPCLCLGPIQTMWGTGSGSSCAEAVANAYIDATNKANQVCDTCQLVQNSIVSCYQPGGGGASYGASASVSYKCLECDIF